MSRRITLSAVAGICLLFSAAVRAGGPPWLSLPVDGATPERIETAEKMLSEKLGGKVWKADASDATAAFQKQGNQTYLVFNLNEDVGLADIDAALKGSSISIPRDNLHLFSDAILQIDPRKASMKELTGVLAKMPGVSVQKTSSKDGLLLVTLLMPSPDSNAARRGSVGFEIFSARFDREERGDRSAPDITAQSLPTYSDFRRTIEKHGAALKDVVWSASFGCRPLGAVAGADAATTTSAKQVD
jgi:hypothetical protein